MKDKWNKLDQLLETLSEMGEDSSVEEASALERILKRHKKSAPVRKMEEESALMRVLRKYKHRKPKDQEVEEDVEEDFFQSFLEEMDEEDQPDPEETPRKKRKPVRLSEEDLLDEALQGDDSDIYAVSRGGLWLGVLLGAAVPYSRSSSLLLVPDIEKNGLYYVFSRNRRVEMDLEFMENGALKVNIQQAPNGFYRNLRLILQSLRRIRFFLPPLETPNERLKEVLSVFQDLKVKYKAEEAE